MSQNIFTAVLVKKDGKLQHEKKSGLELYNSYLESVDEGAKVEVIFQVQESNATALQISKVHANIRELAGDTGHTFEEIKNVVKEKCGLYTVKEEKGEKITLFKSFADCSRQEINLAIQASIEIGENLGINLY